MTKERAIILLCQMYLPHFDDEEKEAITMGIEALEKQIERKPLEVNVKNRYTKYKCPTCKEEVHINLHITHCECGQKLDWSEADGKTQDN